MPRNKKKSKAVTFSVIQVIDPETGKQVSKLVPDHRPRNNRQMAIIQKFGDELPENEMPLFPWMEPDVQDPDHLTKEERERNTVSSLFPNDGYDYSQHVMERTSGGVFMPANYQEKPVIPADVRVETFEGQVHKFNQREKDVMRLEQENVSKNKKVVLKIEKTLFNEKDIVSDIALGEEEGEGKEEDGGFDDLLAELTKGGVSEEVDGEIYDDELFPADEDETNDVAEYVLNKNKELDDQFDKIFADFNDDTVEEATGDLGYEDVKNVIDEFQYEQSRNLYSETVDLKRADDVIPEKVMEELKQNAPEGMIVVDGRLKRLLKDDDVDKEELDKIMMATIKRMQEEDSEEEEYDFIEDTRDRTEWDVQSIVSTYQDSEHQPTGLSDMPKRIELSSKTGMPKNVLPTKQRKSAFVVDTKMPSQKRTKDETPEEKRRRKKLAKLLAKQNRLKKKQLKDAYKKEVLFRQHLDAIPHRHQKVKVNYV